MNTSDKVYVFNLDVKNDSRGKMCIGEYCKNLPFLVKRIFFQYDFSQESCRGQHANINSSFVFICIEGSCTINVDDASNKKSFTLNNPINALYVAKKTWKEMTNFSNDCILLVLSDTEYNEKEYIKDYNVFLNETRMQGDN